MSYPKPPPPFVVAINVISADGLKFPLSLFSLHRPFRPFVTLSIAPAQLQYKTTVADGELFPSSPIYFGDVFRIPLDADFFSDRCFVFLPLFSKRLLFRPALVGWCRMPAIWQPSVGSVRHLSYRLMAHGKRSLVIVNLAVKVAGPMAETCQAVIDVNQDDCF